MKLNKKIFELVKRKDLGFAFGTYEGDNKLEQFYQFDLEFEGGIKLRYTTKNKKEAENIKGIKVSFVDNNHYLNHCPKCGKFNYLCECKDVKEDVFINHIKSHLHRNQKVICKICGKTVEEIYKENEEEITKC